MMNQQEPVEAAITTEKRVWSTPVIEVLRLAEAQNSGAAAPDPSIAQAVS